MSRYRSYGRLDDQFATEGDTFFLRMNARLRPNQLKPGEVTLSKNGRMNDDGTWQPRKGLNTLFGTIRSGDDAITLPYIILSASRSSNVVTAVLDQTPSLSFIVGDNITIDGLNFTGDDPNGTFALASVNFNTRTITYASTGSNEVFNTIGASQRWGTIDVNYSSITQTWASLNPIGRTSVASMGNAIPTTLNYVVTNAVRASNVVTLTLEDTPASEFVVSGTVHVDDIDASINGSHTITAINTSAKTVSFANTGADTTFTVNSKNVGNTSVASTTENFTLDDDAVNGVFGSAVYSDATSENDDFIFSATNNLCLIVRLKDSKLYKCRYEQGGESVDAPCGMTQGFDKMFIFRTTKTTLSASPTLNRVAITEATQSGQTITVTTESAHNRLVGDFVTLTRLGNWEYNPNDCYQVATIPSSTQLTVTMTESQTKTFNVSGAQVEYFEDFERVDSGAYTAPAYLTDASTASVSGVITMDVTSHGLEIGDRLTIHTSQSAIYDNFIGSEVVVTSVPSVNQFTFNLGVKDDSNHSLTVSKPLALGKGFIHQPGAPFGEFHQRRLWLPYQYSSASPPADRGIRDEIVASDILDSDTFDEIGNQFRISSGKSDFVVGIKGFTQDSVVVFNRKSIHLLTGVSGSLADVKTSMVTDEVGASARKSIVQVANQILFLSDQGIYSVNFIDEYNLRGTGTPISETIQPYIDRINQDFAHLSCGVYFNNRYWLAVPLDSSVGAGDGNKLNTIFVYNFINQGFESIDTVNSTDFAIREILVAREGSQNALYLTTEEGGVHKLDALDGDKDLVVQKAGELPQDGIPVVSQLTTRQYDADSFDRKTFSRAELHIKSSEANPSNANIQFIAEDPDSTSESTSISTLLGSLLDKNEEASMRLRVNKRGFGIQADLQPTQGRPYVRATKVDARITDRSTTSVL